MERDPDPQLVTRLGKHADYLEFPRSTDHFIGHWVALVNKSTQMAAHMWMALRNGWRCCGFFQKENKNMSGRFFKGRALCDAAATHRWPLRKVSKRCLFNR
ncbi:hypothetical protein DQ04_01231000 [Trypanosoma grayi]|uniref:hypothetical protein n=1 Tax=Trypanosoma grayi TaxID=71804 RepID=UPI0004F3F8B0|nr:hypothetical protein DQ04_01231000 [Trypanosoma grayi]KEG13065.1 hypothetical protein DQ04_01231000 [Trypanosoma grayi]